LVAIFTLKNGTILVIIFFSLQRLKDAIVQDYQNQCNSQFKNKKKEFQYLHHKLEHIKKLVHDYDTRYGGSSNSLNGGHQRSHLTASS